LSAIGRLASRATRALGIGRQHRPSAPKVRAGYDAATYDTTNEKHWNAADYLNANAGLDASTRQMLRDRSRYESANNGYYGGVIETIAQDVVGSGPRPQVRIPGDSSREMSRLIERLWTAWASATALAEDLTLMQEACVRDGESFAMMRDNPGLAADGRTRVQVDLQVYEAEQISDPWDFGLNPLYTDGVRFDEYGNALSYTLLKNHPGGVHAYRSWDTVEIPATQVCHWYKVRRAGQHRGVPWMVAALPLFAQLRRYTLATLSAAELAAMLAGIMETDAPPGEQAVSVEAMDTVAMVRGALLTLPAGWKASQFKPEQPITNYGQFKTEILNEVGRGGNVPLNIVSGNSSGYNYSSARLDRQLYYRAIKRERGRMKDRFLDRLFLRWAREAIIAYGLAATVPPPELWSWSWFWDGFESIDPQKDAQTDAINLENGTTTLAEICAERGQDWEDVIRQRAIEKKLMADLGVSDSSMSQGKVAAVAASFDESKIKRDDDGKFGDGAGGSSSDKSTPEEQYKTESVAKKTERKAEDRQRQKDREKEENDIHRKYDKETRAVEKQDELIEKQRDKENAKRQSQRDKEDEKDDDKTTNDIDKEQEKATNEIDKELDSLNEREEKGKKEINDNPKLSDEEKRQKLAELDAEISKEYADYEKRREAVTEPIEEKHLAEQAKRQAERDAKREAEDEEIKKKREAEDTKREIERKKQLDDIDDRRYADSEKLSEKHYDEDQEIEERRAKEDKELKRKYKPKKSEGDDA
jgi:lambda family phage portal protein